MKSVYMQAMSQAKAEFGGCVQTHSRKSSRGKLAGWLLVFTRVHRVHTGSESMFMRV
jgi:hypothetical protein